MKRSMAFRTKNILRRISESARSAENTYDSINSLSWEDASLLFDYLDQHERGEASRLLEEFANLGTNTNGIRKAFPLLTADESDDDLIALGEQLRQIWPRDHIGRLDRDMLLDYSSGITGVWLIRHSLDFPTHGKWKVLQDWRWLHHRGLGAYRPYANVHARLARAYLMNKYKFAAYIHGSPVTTRCCNCARYFVPKRIESDMSKQQKHCMAKECRRYRNRVKANRYNQERRNGRID